MKILQATDDYLDIQISDGVNMHMRARTWAGMDNRASRYHAATRIYVSWGPADVTLKDGSLAPLPSYATRQENGSVLPEDQAKEDAEFRVYNKAEMAAGQRMIEAARSTIDFLTENHTDPFKARFSRKAGCSCPCSPGWIADRGLLYNGRPVDIWLTRTHEHRNHNWSLGSTYPEPENSYYKCDLCGTYRQWSKMSQRDQYLANEELAIQIQSA